MEWIAVRHCRDVLLEVSSDGKLIRKKCKNCPKYAIIDIEKVISARAPEHGRAAEKRSSGNESSFIGAGSPPYK